MAFIRSQHILDFCRGLDSERRVSCQALYYWTELKKGKGEKLPHLEDLDFAAMGEIRDNLFLLSTGNGGGKFIVQTCGKVLSEVCGRDPQGHSVADAFPQPLNESAFECCDTSVSSHQPMISHGTILFEDDSEIDYRMIFLPLSDDDKSVDHLFGALSFRISK